MIEPKKSNRTYGADPLLRAASLEKEFNSKVRTPEQQKALAQLRRENLDTSITKYNEAVNLLSKDKVTPTTDYQKRLANGLKAQGILAQSDAQASQKVSEEHTQRLQRDASTLSEGFFGPILNYGKGLFEPRIKATYKKYTDGSGQSAEVYSDAGKHYKKVGNKVQLASAKDIQESGMFKDFEATASDMHNSDSYYAGRASRGAIHGAWSEFTNNALGSALATIARAGAQLGSVGSKTIDGKYNSISEALGDLDKTGMNSFNMIGAGALNLWMKASLAADKATFNNKEDQANYAKNIAELDIRVQQLKKEQEDWIKSEVGERAAQMKKGNTKQTLSGKLLEASLSLDKILDDSRAEEQITKDINSSLSQRAQDLRGKSAGTFAQKNKQVSQEQVFDPVTNKKYAREKVDDNQKMSDGKASAWDVKEIVLDDNGNVTLDSSKQPVYKDKFSVWQSLSSSDTTAFNDKYFMGDTLLQEGVESLADIASTVILSKGLGAVAKGASLTGKGVSALIPNVVPKTLSAVNKATLGKSMKYIDNMLGKVDSGLTNLGNKSKIGTKMVSNFKPKSVLDASDFAGVSTVRAAKLKTLARNMTLAYLEGGGESDQIAFDVKTKILEEKVDKLANISTEDIAQEIMQTDSSMSPEQAFLLAGKEADRLRGEWAVANEDSFNEAQAYAAVGQEVARATNNLGFITNLGQVTAVLKNKTFSSTLHKNGYDAINPWRPIKEIMSKDYIKGIKRILPGEAAKQGLIEGLLEEGFLNTSAERAGLAAGKGEGYALLDILDNIDSEFVESVYAGAIIGAGQSKTSSVYQGFSGRREYKAQQAEITKMLNRTPETKAQLKDFFNTSIEAEHVKKILDDIDELSRTTKTVNGSQVQKTKEELAEDKSKVADLQEQMFITNAITMASKGLSGKLGESIESAMTAEGLEAEDIAQLQAALDFNKYIAASFDRFAATEGYDPITLTLNRAKRKLMMDQTTTAEANISARKQSIESAIAERKLDRLEQYAEDTTETSDKAAELLDTYMAMSADQSEAFLNDTTDKELLELDTTLNSVPKAMREAIKTLDDVYSALQEEYSKPFSNNQRLATLNYIEHKEFKDALFNATTEDEIEQMIQGNFDVAFSERELELAERAKANIKAQALAESIPKQVTKQAVEEFHSPEAARLKAEQAQQAQDEIDEYIANGRTTPTFGSLITNRINAAWAEKMRKEQWKKGDRKTPTKDRILKKEAKKERERRLAERDKLYEPKEEPKEALPVTIVPAVGRTPILPPEKPVRQKKVEQPKQQQSPTTSPRTTGEIQIGDDVGDMGGYSAGTTIAVTDIHSGGETVKEAIAQGVDVQVTSIFITDAGEILANVSIGDEVTSVRLKGKVSESQERGRVTYQMELGDDVTDSVEFELMETVDLLELETKYGVPVLSTLPDENGNATMFYQFGPNVKIKLRLPNTDVKLENDLQKLAEEYFGLEVGDVKPLGEIMAPGAFPDGMTADTEVEVISITHPLEAVQVMNSVTFATAYVEAMPASDMDLDESLRNVSKPAENTEASNRIRAYMTQAAQEMDKVLGRPATFEDYLDSRVESLGEQSVFDDYSKYAAMWAYTGRATENIHDTYFSTDMLMEDIKTKYFHFADEEEYAEEVVGSIGEVITARKKKDIQESEPEVEPVVEGLTDAEVAELEGEFKSEFYDRVFEDHRQTSASNTPGNLGLTYQTDVETGEIVRDLGLASSPFMNNSNWLSPNNIKVGDKLTVKAPVLGEVLDVPITDWVQNEFGTWVLNPDYITFGELMAREGFVEGSPEYIRRVPMKAYTADGKEAFWIRDMAWINPSNYNSSIDVRSTVTSVRAKNLSIRTNTILNNGTEITVTKRDLGSVTTFTKLTDTGKTKDTEFNTDPTSLLATAINQNTLYVDGKRVEVNSPESGINIVNNIVYSGAPYALRHVSTEIVNGKEVKNYLAVMLHTNLPQQGESINQSVRNTVKFGVVASYYNHVAKAVKAGTIDRSALLSLQERFNLSGEQIKEITEAINSTYNVDINSYSGKQSGGLASFINKFVSFSEGSKGREGDYYEVLTSVDDAKRPDGQAYGYVQKGQIGFNIKGQTTEAKQTGIDDYGGRVNTTVTLNPNKMSAAGIETTASMIEQMFSTGGSFSKMRFDADPRHLGQDNKTVIIDQDGNVTSTDTSYSDFVKQNVYTNVAAFRLSETEYVTDIQPAINFEESSDSITPELSNIVTPGSVPTPETPVAPVITPEARKVFNGLEDELANLPDEVKSILGDVSFVGLERDIYGSRKPEVPLQSYTNYSGGAKGADTVWASIGKKFGLGKQVDYLTSAYDKLTAAQKKEVEEAYIKAAGNLGRRTLPASEYSGKLVRRDYLQAKAADAIFAVSRIVNPGEMTPDGKYRVKSKAQSVDGGTGYAVQMAIDMGKPVHVFNTLDNQWYKWNYSATKFDAIDTPTLTEKFAGIGSRDLSEEGAKAIEEVYAKSAKNSKKVQGDLDESLRNLTAEQSQSLSSIKSNSIEGLDPVQQKIVVEGLYDSILKQLHRADKYDLSNLQSLIAKAPNVYLQPELTKSEEALSLIKLSLLEDTYPTAVRALEIKVEKLNAVLNNQAKLTNVDSVTPGDLVVKFQKFFQEEFDDTEGTEQSMTDSTGEVDESYDKDLLTKEIVTSFSTELQVFFSGIPKFDRFNKSQKTFFTGIKEHEDSKNIIGALRSVMVDTESSADDLQAKLLEKSLTNPVYKEIYNKFIMSPDKVKNEILYKMIQDRLTMKSIMINRGIDFETTILDPNSNEASIMHRMDWSANLVYQENLTDTNEDGTVSYNKEKVDAAIENFKEVGTLIRDLFASKEGKELAKAISKKEEFVIPEEIMTKTKELVKSLGVEISDIAFEEFMYKNILNLNTKNEAGLVLMPLRSLNKISAALSTPGTEVLYTEKDYNLFQDISGVIKGLSNAQVAAEGNPITKSFRSGGKNYQGTIQKTMISKLVSRLKDTSSKYFKDLSVIPYSKGNYLLGALLNDPKIRSKFSIDYLGPEALVKEGVKYGSESRKINMLPEADNILTELGMFSETASLTDFKVDSKPGIRFRLARMFSPTLSDKSQMVTYTMPVVDLRANNYNLETGEVSTDVLDFLREQIFDAELERIISVLRHRPNIKGYKAAGAYFNSIPAFNAIAIETMTGESITEVNILDYLVVAAKDPSFDLSKAKALFSDNAQAILTEVIAEEVANKLKTWGRLGITTTGGRSNVSKKYLEAKNFIMETPLDIAENAPKVLAVDYVINNLLNQNNTYQLVLGDIAQFAKGKPAPMVEEDVATGLTDDNGKPITKKVRRASLEGLISLVKMTGESVTKRAAMLIAPGSELANSKNDVYTQIMINDAIRSVSVAKGLIKQYYGEVSLLNELVLNRLDSAEVELSELLRSERSLEDKTGSPRLDLDKEIEGLKGKLKKLNPELAGYFEIEGTDAQEYTTWKEHLDIILRQGRLDKADHAKIMSAYKKLEAGEDINSEELRVVMNPIKPVYAGPLTEYGKDENGATDLNNPIAMRTVYIKSSSFPLLPQLTKGLDLDRTRDIMEKLSAAKGTNVRLSYETANKVGHTPTDLTVEDLYNLSFEDLYSIDENGVARGRLANSILDLDREFFKVQQDTPYKSAKFLKKGIDDMVTMGSQMWKLLMGNNINKGEKFIFPITFDPNLLSVLQERGITIPTKDGMITGKGLDLVKTFIESEYFDNQKTILFSELGLSADGQVVDPSETRKALKEIIQNELATGAYPAYANDEVILDDVDNLELDFRVPLWMTSNANKLETLLQGIITSRMIKIKLPGYQHISTSSEGFVKSFESLDNSIKSSIVWVDPNHSGQLKSTVTVDGKVSFSEVLIQSKMRTRVPVLDKDGKPVMGKNDKPKTEFKMIDLTQAPYATRNERGDLILDMKMMDPALVEMFSFRIPTSSHQSGAMLKVVGFLPEASGDMLVVPKEHTVQIGEDYDIDKRNVYKNHYTVDKSGRIRKLSGKRFLEPIDAKEFQSAEFRFQQRKIQRQLNAESAYVDYAVLEDELSILLELEAEMFPDLSETSVTPFTQDIERIGQELEDKFEVLEQETIVSFRNDRLTVQEKLDKGREKYKTIAGKTYGRLKGNIRMNASQKAKTTFYEDSMVNIYKSVFMTPDRDIQNKIGKILSFDIATTTAEAIQGKLSVGSSPYFTTYSDEYQRNQQKLGAAGKVGIGQHSNAVTFQSQMERLADKINLNRVITLGNLKSTGVLGSTTTIDGYRDIADVHTENQNSATDNVKAQIMGKRNENAYTMGVLSMMTFRGFDLDTVDAVTMDGKKRLQVPSLFISQPALRNYVDAMDASKSALQTEKTPATTVMAEVYYSYMSKLTDKQAQELFTVGKSVKYIKDALREGESIFKPGVLESLSTELTSQTLYDNLTNEEANRNPLLQLAVLENFNILSAENDKLNKYQKLINMNTSGLGLSYFEVLDRKEVLNELLLEEDFLNVIGLISDSVLVEGDLVGGEDLTGYIKIGYNYIRPSTTEGVVLLNSIVAAESTMGTVFPYESRGIQYLYKKLRSVDSFGFKKTRFEMMRSFKDFLLSSPDAGFFDGTVREERDRLLQDMPGKQSLAAFLKSMHQSRNDLSLTNDLLKDFRYNQVTAYGVSFINHKADGKSPSDKMDKHRAFLELLQDDYTDLGEWNGETMTPRDLALNLYNYSMLTKDDQGFQGFREFMPADMQEIYGTDKYLQNINRNLDSPDTEMLDRFFTQFIQHNPELVNSYSTSNFTSLYESDSLDNIVYRGGRNLENQLENLENLKSKDMPLGPAVKNLLAYSDSFETVYYADSSEFVAFSVWDVDPSDPTGSSTISENVLFKAERISEYKIRYTRLRKLGNGKVRVDYDANGDVGDLTFTPGPDVQERVLEANRIALNDSAGALIVDGEVMTVNQILGESKNGKEVLGKVIELTPDTAELKGLLLTIYNALDENLAPRIELIDDYVGDKFISHGAYSSETNTIYINSNLGAYIAQEDGMSTLEVLGDLLGEEFLHSMQIRSLSEHVGFNADGSHYLYSEFNTPAHVLSIVKMFDDALTAGVEHPAMKNLKEFVAAVYTRSDFRAELDSKTIGWREKFLRVIRAVVRDFTGDVSFSGKLREDIDKLMGDAWNIQDTLAKTSDEPGFIPNGIKLTYGLPGVTPLTSPRTSDPTNLVNKTGFTMYETERALRTLLSGKPIKLMSKAARAAAKNPRLAQAQSQLVRDIIDQVGKLKNTTIKPENVSDYFTLTETGGVLEIQYTPKEVKVIIPKKEVKQVKEEALDTKVSEEVTTGDTVTYKGEEFLVRGFAKNGNVNLALLDGTPKKGGAVKLSNVTKVSGVTPEAKVAASEPTPQSEVGSMSEYTDVSGQTSLDFSLRNKLPKVKNCM